MFEAVKEVDEATVIKGDNAFLTREDTNSLLSGYVEYSDEINTQFIIEADVTKNKQSIGKMKDNSVFLLKYVESNFHDKPIE